MEQQLKRRDLPAYWRGHIERAASSGQSKKGYCESEGLSTHRFWYWQHKLGMSGRKVAKLSSSSRFIRLDVGAGGGKPSPVRLDLPAGVSVNCTELPPVSWVGELVLGLLGRSH